MHKLTPGGYTGNLNASGDHSTVGSSMVGIKTEMKYSGSAHSMPNHLSQTHHPQNHGQHQQSHPLPSIPSMYTPGSATVSGPHLSNLNRGNMAGMNVNHNVQHGHQQVQQGQQMHSGQHGQAQHHPHGPAHSLLSQSQQQKLQLQAQAQAQLHQHHQQQQHNQQGSTQQAPMNSLGTSHNQHANAQSHAPIMNHNLASHTTAHTVHTAPQMHGQQGQVAPPQMQVGSVGPVAGAGHPAVPTGLLLSGPAAAVLHSTAATSGAPQPIPSLPSVASHAAAAVSSGSAAVSSIPSSSAGGATSSGAAANTAIPQ